MFRQQLGSLSRLTASTLRYASTSTTGLLSLAGLGLGLGTGADEIIPTSQQLTLWILETQRGLARKI